MYRSARVHRDGDADQPRERMVTDDGTARAKYHVEFECIAFRPFKGEVLDATVTQVNKFGFFAEAGPLNLFVSNQLIEDDMAFEGRARTST